MIKSFLVVLTVAVALFFATMFGLLDGIFTLVNVVDAAFLVGLVLFFTGLILITDAMRIFRGIVYTFKKMFSRKEQRRHFYEYLADQEAKDRPIPIGGPLVLIGAVILAASIILSFVLVSTF